MNEHTIKELQTESIQHICRWCTPGFPSMQLFRKVMTGWINDQESGQRYGISMFACNECGVVCAIPSNRIIPQ